MVYENKQDWPEKLAIDLLVTREADIEKVIQGEKVSVRRNDRYADEGDTLLLHGHMYVVENVYPQFLKNMTEANAREEGFPNLASYKEVIENIHQQAVWDPDQIVWAHYLKEK